MQDKPMLKSIAAFLQQLQLTKKHLHLTHAQQLELLPKFTTISVFICIGVPYSPETGKPIESQSAFNYG